MKRFFAVLITILLVSSMAGAATITKGLIGEQDINSWDGRTGTFSRPSSTGGTVTLNKVGTEVDALIVYGGGASYTKATIDSALTAIGTTNKVTLLLRPGTWTITADTTIPANVTLRAPPGAILAISTGVTLTINGPFDAGDYKVFSLVGTGAVAGLSQAKADWYGTDATAITAAASTVAGAGGGYVYLLAKTYTIASTITLNSGVHLIGVKGGTTLSYTGAGTAVNIISASGSGTRIYSGGLRDMFITTSTGVTGVDIDSLSGGIFENVKVDGFSGSSWKLHSSTSGGAVYNRFYNCEGSGATATTSFELSKTVVTGSVTNSNTFIGCRATGATGFAISGGNQNTIITCQIETCTTGIAITEPDTASVNGNIIAFNRFENNTTNISIGAGVTSTFNYGNYHVGGVPYSDSGTRTQIVEPAVGGSSPSGYQFSSPSQIATGSFQFTRTGNGGSSVPAMVVRDTATSSGTPVTLQIETERAGTFLRGQKGAATYFDVSTAGLANFRSGTTVSSPTSGGGLKRMFAVATADIEADASTTITLSIPAGARLLGAQLRVDTALATGETWDAAYSGGSTTAIASGQAVAKNTKVNTMYDENGATAITTNTTNIAITKNGGGSFTAQGTIRAIVYYETAVTLDDAP